MTTQHIAEPLAEDIFRSEWVFALLILPVLIYLFISVTEKYSLAGIIKTVFSNKFANTAYRNRNPGIQLFNVLLGFTSMISIATFILFVEIHYNFTFFDLNPFMLWLFNLLIVSALIAFTYLACLAAGTLSRSVDTFREYLFNVSLNYKLIGILLMILNFFISYLVSVPDKYIIFLSFFTIAIILIFRIIRIVYIFLVRRLSLFYMILYLCTLEFFPALILIRYLSGQAQ
ncbi:MAG: DUF4271 domain-containing protein [Bacteroidales bacterium]|nr:DUF4271 domain-containing protein [Bacteroidales bacterium]